MVVIPLFSARVTVSIASSSGHPSNSQVHTIRVGRSISRNCPRNEHSTPPGAYHAYCHGAIRWGSRRHRGSGWARGAFRPVRGVRPGEGPHAIVRCECCYRARDPVATFHRRRQGAASIDRSITGGPEEDRPDPGVQSTRVNWRPVEGAFAGTQTLILRGVLKITRGVSPKVVTLGELARQLTPELGLH